MKNLICTAVGLLGSLIANIFGGWDSGLIALLGFMSADYITGLIVAGVFKKSKKTENGALESRAGLKGLFRKCMMLVFVYVGYQLDTVLQLSYIRTAVIIGFLANETISLTENAGLMSVPLPPAISKAIDVLVSKNTEASQSEGGNENENL